MPDPAPNHIGTRVSAIIVNAVAALDPADQAERVAWCQEHDQHGVRMHVDPDDDVIELRWGGRPLAVISAADLASDEPLEASFVAEVPDTLPDDL